MREAARLRVEGTRLGMERIALELGIVRGTLIRWQIRFGWRRPAPADRVGPCFYRSRRFGRAYGGDAVGTARDLVTGSKLPLGRIAARAGVSRSTVYRWIARHGWTRPAAVAARHRHRPPYGPAVVAAASELYRTTNLPTSLIAARVAATRERVRHWARMQGWTRPKDGPDPHDGADPHGCVRRGFRPCRVMSGARRDPAPARGSGAPLERTRGDLYGPPTDRS